MSQQDQFFISRKLSSISILLWIISLALPGFVYSSKNDFSFGFQILLTGWIGVIGSYVGWYANVFWFGAIWRLKSSGSKSALTASILASILSLDTFRVDCNVGQSCTPPYGIGIGAALWLIAIFLSFIAAAIREVEIVNNDLPNYIGKHHSLIRKIGSMFNAAKVTGKDIPLITSSLLLIGFVLVVVTLGIYERIVGNTDEQEMFKKWAVFKRTAICTASPKPIEKIHLDKNGILEVVTSIYSDVLSKDPVMFLQLGIPVVRSVTLHDEVPQDRYLKYPPHIETMKSRPVMGEPDAHLETTGVPGRYNIKLRDKNGKVVLDVTQENNCPNINGISNYRTEKLVRHEVALVFSVPTGTSHAANFC